MNAPPDHVQLFESLATKPIWLAIRLLYPNKPTRQELLSIFDGRASYEQITEWRYGRVMPPNWAREMLLAKVHQALPAKAIDKAIRELPQGPGLRVGAKNLANYLARR